MYAALSARAARSLSLAVALAAGTGLATATPAAPAPEPPPPDTAAPRHRPGPRHGPPPGHGPAPLYESTDVAVSGQGAHTYRIPALETLPDGTLVAAYDRRNNSAADLPGDVDVMVRRSTDNGRTWSPPQAVADYDGGAGAGDPSLLADRWTGRLFLFHAYGPKGVGFGNAGMGNDHASTTVLHTDLHYSDDGGRSWHARRLTHDLKDPTWLGIFASSGTGIQLSTGRLVQQYAFRKADASMWAASAYSDDHGETWRLGTPVGPLMDENKTVELADGRIMLNSRTGSTTRRLVAHSRDGGLTYSSPVADDELVDPVNNASILRYDPTAPPGHPRAHWLLFSNTASATARRNLTVRLSCDDGRSWPVSRVVTPGPSAYSTLTRLKDGTFGLLYESGPYRKITFARFDGAWLGAGCPAA
ncbi:exo-alpha-sialidase [Streptomyces chattanoogensis]|uniref:sialidase family protein n=1 Tax=Streptomyces chattanoogensis TaxID=66876 RepID=UPI0036B8A701